MCELVLYFATLTKKSHGLCSKKLCFSNFVQEFLVNLRLVFKIRNKFPLELFFYLIQ